MIKRENEYIQWLEINGIGDNDKIASSPKSYVSYLKSVSRIIEKDISDEFLKSYTDVDEVIEKIRDKAASSTISNYKTALRRYVDMVADAYISQGESYITDKAEKTHKCFKMPKAVTIMGRSSSITNSFFNGIIPVIEPSNNDIDELLGLLELDKDKLTCVYCGDKSTEWDHFRPLIVDKKHTGYISEIQNLVPSCGKCNQSKGNLNWKEWMFGDAKQSPKTRQISDIELKADLLEKFENWREPSKVIFEDLVGGKVWSQYEDMLMEIRDSMENAQELSNLIKEVVKKEFSK